MHRYTIHIGMKIKRILKTTDYTTGTVELRNLYRYLDMWMLKSERENWSTHTEFYTYTNSIIDT